MYVMKKNNLLKTYNDSGNLDNPALRVSTESQFASSGTCITETGDQRASLGQHGCTQYQGYLFSKPISPEAFERLFHLGSAM
jgi:predicted signal transduction protein with EAL and GGDEF domain